MGRKRIVWIFQAISKPNLTREDLDMAKKRKLTAVQDNTIRINYVKAKINKTQQNKKLRLYGDRGETINHIISEYRELAQKEFKFRHDWLEKMIHWELSKKLKFDRRKKWYMHNLESFVEN